MKRLRKVGVRSGCRDQIGLQTDVIEDPIGGEVGRDRGRSCGEAMDAHECIGDLRGKLRIGIAVAQLRLPQRVAVRRQELHGQRAGRFIDAQQLRRGTRDSGVRALHPARLVAIALDGCLPIRRHTKLRQRALDADRAGGKVDAPDVGRYAAGQSFATRVSTCVQQAHAAQGIEDFRRRRLGHSVRMYDRYATRMPAASFIPTM